MPTAITGSLPRRRVGKEVVREQGVEIEDGFFVYD